MPPLFLISAVAALVAASQIKTLPTFGAMLAILAAVICLPTAIVQQGPDLAFLGVVWLVVALPLLLTAAMVTRARRASGSSRW